VTDKLQVSLEIGVPIFKDHSVIDVRRRSKRPRARKPPAGSSEVANQPTASDPALYGLCAGAAFQQRDAGEPQPRYWKARTFGSGHHGAARGDARRVAKRLSIADSLTFVTGLSRGLATVRRPSSTCAALCDVDSEDVQTTERP
jgi:hypothetical protein